MLIRFEPIYQTRVWGGRELERVFHRPLPADDQPYGESWELVDRPEAQSTVAAGPFAGKTLHELWQGEHREAIFGTNAPQTERFPLLLKILDARDVLSLQVHPPVEKAAALHGEPKTEMWVIADATPGAQLYVGVHEGVTDEVFAEALATNSADRLVPSLQPSRGDFIFIPSGRLHAIGAGFLIFEIQQNSDTTYRVYDWGRKGLDGRPRDLHVAQSLASIDFTDTNPQLGTADPVTGELVACEHFRVCQHHLPSGTVAAFATAPQAYVAIVVEGYGTLSGEPISPGQHVLVSADHGPLHAQASSEGPLWLLLVSLS
jgi:mannose-6-phosphate isomerase